MDCLPIEQNISKIYRERESLLRWLKTLMSISQLLFFSIGD